MSELERYKEALAALEIRFHAIAGAMDSAAATLEVRAILNPPPVYEEVEVVRWSWGGCFRTFDTKEEAERDANPGFETVKLTGTFKRPVPQKVEKSVSVEARIGDTGISRPVFGPWENYPECHGKTGILTFKWQK